jgi:hypothetical protein
MTISEVSKKYDLSQDTLRYYDGSVFFPVLQEIRAG